MEELDRKIAELKEENRLADLKKLEEEIAALREKFDKWDRDEDGLITYDEVKQFLLETEDEEMTDDEQVTNIFRF